MLVGKCAIDHFEHEWFYGNILSFSTTQPANTRDDAKETSRQVSELNPLGTLDDGKKMIKIEEDPAHCPPSWRKSCKKRRKSRMRFGSIIVGDINGVMPLLSDDIAMKEHLKSWAYAVAVACSVK